jgi:hypothetical protein
MPIAYDIDTDRRLIRTRCPQGTTLADVLAHFAELRAIPSLPQPLNVLLDLSGMDELPGLGQMEAAAGGTASLTPNLRWGALAIVVGTEAARQTATIYGALISYYFERVRVFRDPTEADLWLPAARPRTVADT